MPFTSAGNPILVAFRERSDHSVQAAETWTDHLEDPTEPGDREIQDAISDALDIPLGPGWEGAYWVWSAEIYRDALAVLKRFARIYG